MKKKILHISFEVTGPNTLSVLSVTTILARASEIGVQNGPLALSFGALAGTTKTSFLSTNGSFVFNFFFKN